jgi:hypothetical protein
MNVPERGAGVSGVRETLRVRRALLSAIVVVLLVGAASVFGGTAGARQAPTALRPDIVPVASTQVQIRVVHGSKRLYLSFETEDTGAGPLEMQPVAEDCDGDGSTTDDRTALQHVYGDTDGSGDYTPGTDAVIRTVVAGCFVYHAAHGHWHFEDYANYRLLTLAGERLRSHSKVGFCMLDTSSVDPDLPGHPSSRVYTGCPDLALQGISVGWADTYTVYTPGQFINVDGLAPATYCLVGIADPSDKIVESDETDNTIRTRVHIGLNRASVRSPSC